MKLSFKPPEDGTIHAYCLLCGSENVDLELQDGKKQFTCRACSQVNGRALIIDPKISWWTDDTNEYWHESVGLFITDPNKKILLFELTKFPFGFTVPAGHVDANETPESAAKRELEEETGIKSVPLTHVLTTDLHGDSCSRGADTHRWHCFATEVSNSTSIVLNDEGVRPVWLSLQQALNKELTFAARHLLESHGSKLLQANPS